MTIPPNLNGLPGISTLGTAPGAAADNQASGFEDTLRGAIQGTQQMQNDAQEQVNNLLSGNSQDIHSTTLAVEQANLSFELMLQVRNKIVNAYQEISRLQF